MPTEHKARRAHHTQRSAVVATTADALHPRLLRRAGQLIQARVMTLFGLSAADPRGNLEGVAAALAAISTQPHLPILVVLALPCNATSRHGGSLTQRNRLASGC